MKNEFVPYELALELKELGFDEVTICVFNRDRALKSNITSNPFGDRIEKDIHDERLSAPLLQQAFRWFREKYPNIEFILPMKKKKDLGVFWGGGIKSEEMNFPKSYSSNFKTYEQAELECLKQLIKMAKNEPK